MDPGAPTPPAASTTSAAAAAGIVVDEETGRLEGRRRLAEGSVKAFKLVVGVLGVTLRIAVSHVDVPLDSPPSF